MYHAATALYDKSNLNLTLFSAAIISVKLKLTVSYSVEACFDKIVMDATGSMSIEKTTNFAKSEEYEKSRTRPTKQIKMTSMKYEHNNNKFIISSNSSQIDVNSMKFFRKVRTNVAHDNLYWLLCK